MIQNTRLDIKFWSEQTLMLSGEIWSALLGKRTGLVSLSSCDMLQPLITCVLNLRPGNMLPTHLRRKSTTIRILNFQTGICSNILHWIASLFGFSLALTGDYIHTYQCVSPRPKLVERKGRCLPKYLSQVNGVSLTRTICVQNGKFDACAAIESC